MKLEKKTVYIYEINGKEKIKISNAAEARKWDEIFDDAVRVDNILQKNDPGIKLSEADRNDLCIYLAKHKDDFLNALQAGDGSATASNGSSTATTSKKTGLSKIANIPTSDRIEVPGPTIPSSKDGFSL